jgi:hypothetical protein
VVPGVQHFGAEVQCNSFSHPEVLDHRAVPPGLWVAANSAEAAGGYPHVVCRHLRAVRVESGIGPAVHIALLTREHRVSGVAREQHPHVAEAERRSALPLHHAVMLPAAPAMKLSGHVAAETPTATEWKFPDSTYDQLVRSIEARNAPVSDWIYGVRFSARTWKQ